MNLGLGLLLAYGSGLWMQQQGWLAQGCLVVGTGLLLGWWGWRYQGTAPVPSGVKVRAPMGFMLMILVWFLGLAWGNLRTPYPEALDPFHHITGKSSPLQGIIASEPVQRESGWQFMLVAANLNGQVVQGRVWVQWKSKTPLVYGQHLHLMGELRLPAPALNKGAFSYRDYLARQHIFSTFRTHQGKILAPPDPSLWNTVYRYKRWVRAQLQQAMPTAQAELLYSLVLGTDGLVIAAHLKEQFGQLGLQHVLAVSGFQVQLLLIAILAMANRLGWNRWITATLGSSWVVLYLILTGAPASVMRAGLMALLGLLGLLLFRQLDTRKGLQAAAGLLLVWDPLLLQDIGFQFSVLATWGLLQSSQPLAERMTWLPLPLAQLVAVPVAAQLWVLPLQLWYFGSFSWLFLPANLLAAVFVPILTYLVLGMILMMLLHTGLFYTLAALSSWLLTLFLALTQGLLRVPNPVWYWFGLTPWAVAVLYGLLLLSHGSLPQRHKWQWVLVIALILHLGLSPVVAQQSCPVKISFLYVEQGDAILIETPQQKVLIDAGPSHPDPRLGAAARHLWPTLQRQGIHHLDTVFVTHAHEDHYGGLGLLLEKLPIDQVIAAPRWSGEHAHLKLLRQLLQPPVELNIPRPGQRFDLGREVFLEVLAPLSAHHEEENDRSLVLRLTHGNLKILFTGDIEAEAEAELTQHYGSTLAADILKVPHHGSRTSSTPAFLAAVQPQLAVISAGQNNRFHHPHSEVVERYHQAGIALKQTQRDGAVCVCSQGEKWWVETAFIQGKG